MKKTIMKDYKELRKMVYPPVEEQLDFIYHNGIDEWKKMISEIKDKYPSSQRRL
jgi:hypothetical protein